MCRLAPRVAIWLLLLLPILIPFAAQAQGLSTPAVFARFDDMATPFAATVARHAPSERSSQRVTVGSIGGEPTRSYFRCSTDGSADGADQTRVGSGLGSANRNGEPFGGPAA